MENRIRINVTDLLRHLNVSKDYYARYGVGYPTPYKDEITRFIDNGSDILAVAHLDTVEIKHNPVYDPKSHSVISPNLDDRLGVYILLDLLPDLQIQPDILLTDHEENCNSTAQYFKSSKHYNWIFELDRSGIDPVAYQYKHPALEKIMKRYGFERLDYGSYTDIVELEDIGSSGINFGVGYHNQHTSYCYANLYEVEFCVKRFVHFYRQNCKISLPYKLNDYYYPVSKIYTGYNLNKYPVTPYKSSVKYLDDYTDYKETGSEDLSCVYCESDFDSDLDNIDDFISAGDLCSNCRDLFYGDSIENSEFR